MAVTPLGNLDGTSLKEAGTVAITKDTPLPGMGRGRAPILDPKRQRVRYDSFNMREPLDLEKLEKIETKAWRNEGIYILDIKDYTWMDTMFYLVKYIEDIE